MGNCCSQSCVPLARIKNRKPENSLQEEQVSDLDRTVRILVAKTVKQESLSGGISKKVFMRYMFPLYPKLSEKIFESFADDNEYENQQVQFIEEYRFSYNMKTMLNEMFPEDLRHMYVSFYTSDHMLSRDQLVEFLNLVYSVSMENVPEIEKVCPFMDKMRNSVVRSMFKEAETVHIEHALHWIEFNSPLLIGILHSYVVNAFKWTDFDDDFNPGRSSGQSNILLQRSHSLESLPKSQLWILSTTIPDLYTRPSANPQSQLLVRSSQTSQNPYSFVASEAFFFHWTLLYNSVNHGFGVNRFSYHVFDYKGPTVTFLSCRNNMSFCVCVGVEWHESDSQWGDRFCHLIQLSPIYCLIDKGAGMVYVNFSIHGHPLGLRFGTDRNLPLVIVDELFMQVSYQGEYYTLETIQVWGCGSKDVYETYKEMKVKKANKGTKENVVDKFLLSLATKPDSAAV